MGAEYKCLEISMRDHLLVQVLQPLKKLIHDILSLGFAYLIACPRSVVNICEKVSSSTQLEKYVNEFIVFFRVVYFIDVGVFQSHKDPDLLHNLVNFIIPLRPDALTRHLALSRWIYGQVHRGKGSTPQALRSNDIIANVLLRWMQGWGRFK